MYSKKASHVVRWAAKQIVNIMFMLSISMWFVFGYIFTGMHEQVYIGYMFMAGLLGVVLMSGIIIGALRLGLPETNVIMPLIALTIGVLATMSNIIFMETCMISGELLDASGIEVLYLGNGYNIVTHSAYLTIVNITKTLITGALGMFLVYYATMIWDLIEKHRNDEKVNDG